MVIMRFHLTLGLNINVKLKDMRRFGKFIPVRIEKIQYVKKRFGKFTKVR